MSILMLKSILALVLILVTLVQMFLMYEVFGRTEKKYDAGKLKRIHRVNGVFFVCLYFFIAYFCLRYIAESKDELSPRVALHGLLAFSVIILLALKVTFIRVYRQFYGKVLTLGPLIALLSFGMVASSGGFYLLVSLF